MKIRKSDMLGQMNLFDYISQLEAQTPVSDEVEMIGLEIPAPEKPVEKETEKSKTAAKKQVNTLHVEPATKLKTTEPAPEEVKREAAVLPELSEDQGRVVMQRTITQSDGSKIVISYVNYNKVCIDNHGEREIHRFENSKDTVDYYFESIDRYTERRS